MSVDDQRESMDAHDRGYKQYIQTRVCPQGVGTSFQGCSGGGGATLQNARPSPTFLSYYPMHAMDGLGTVKRLERGNLDECMQCHPAN